MKKNSSKKRRMRGRPKKKIQQQKYELELHDLVQVNPDEIKKCNFF